MSASLPHLYLTVSGSAHRLASMMKREFFQTHGPVPLLASVLVLSLAGHFLPNPAGSAEPTRPPGAKKPGPEPVFRILSDRELPAALAKATDVRWAGDRSIYLALRDQGVVEIPLEPAPALPREVVAGGAQLGGFFYSTLLGASARHLVAAAPGMAFTSVDLGTQIRRDEAFDAIHALDVQGDRLLILGMRRDEQMKVGTDGAIAWLGSLDRKLADLRPVAYDATGPGIRNMMRCGGMRLGGVRFLEDGRFVVVPGVQAGVQLYDREGKAIRSWDTGPLGIDSDCGALTEEASRALMASIEDREEWTSRRRTVDTVLPLPDGIGLVLRSRESGRLRWDLVVLKMDGGTSRHRLPVEAGGYHFHLRGDFRAGKMVFLLSEERTKDHKYPAPRLFVALPPSH